MLSKFSCLAALWNWALIVLITLGFLLVILQHLEAQGECLTSIDMAFVITVMANFTWMGSRIFPSDLRPCGSCFTREHPLKSSRRSFGPYYRWRSGRAAYTVEPQSVNGGLKCTQALFQKTTLQMYQYCLVDLAMPLGPPPPTPTPTSAPVACHDLRYSFSKRVYDTWTIVYIFTTSMSTN